MLYSFNIKEPHHARGHAYAHSSSTGIAFTLLYMIKACAVLLTGIGVKLAIYNPNPDPDPDPNPNPNPNPNLSGARQGGYGRPGGGAMHGEWAQVRESHLLTLAVTLPLPLPLPLPQPQLHPYP